MKVWVDGVRGYDERGCSASLTAPALVIPLVTASRFSHKVITLWDGSTIEVMR